MSVEIVLGKGINFDAPASELELGVPCGDTKNVRFANGMAESFEGSYAEISASVDPYWAELYQPSSAILLVYGGSARVYSYDQAGGTHTQITRYTDGVTISTITYVTTTATLTTSSAHGLSTGNTVTVYLASPSAYNGTFSITVTGATTFTYTMASDPGANATTVGAYSYDVQSDFTSAVAQTSAVKLSGGVFNGTLLYNNPHDGLYYWNGDTSTRLRKVPTSYKADASKPFRSFIVQIAPTISGTKYPLDVVWSTSTEPGAIPTSFVGSSTNDAGRFPLAETGGPLLDLLQMGEQMLLYKRDAIFSMRYTGGDAVFAFQKLPGAEGVFSPRCVVDTPVGHVFLSASVDVRIHTGGESRSIADGTVRKWLRENINTFSNGSRCACLTVLPNKSEVWVCIPQDSATGAPNSVLVWNWISQTWSFFKVGTTGATDGVFGYTRGFFPVLGAARDQRDVGLFVTGGGGKIAVMTGQASATPGLFLGSSLTAVIEFKGLHFGKRDRMKSVERTRWNFDSASGAGSVTVKHGSSKFADTAPSYATGATYTIGTTDWACSRGTQGRFGAIHATWATNASGSPYILRTLDVDGPTWGGLR